MNNKLIALYNGITNIDDAFIDEALADMENETKIAKIKRSARIKIVKILSVAASIVFIITVLFPTLVANVSALGRIVEEYVPGYYKYSQNFAVNKQSVPEDNLDKIIYYSELSDFHDLSTSFMHGYYYYLDDYSVEEAVLLLEKAEGLLNAASNGPISFLEYLGFKEGTYSYTVDDKYFQTDINYNKVVDEILSYFTKGVFKGILYDYVGYHNGKARFPLAKNEDNTFEILSTKKNENDFFTSIISSGEKTYTVYYAISCVDDENVIGYYWCQNYTEYDLNLKPETDPVTESDIEEMLSCATEYMRIRAKWVSETLLPIHYLGFADEDIQSGEYIGSYLKTNVDYTAFYNKMLQFMTPELFEREYSETYIELDGKLCSIDGGGGGWEFDQVLELIPSENGYYNIVYRWKNFFEDEYYIDKEGGKMFFEKIDGRWVVADYKTD